MNPASHFSMKLHEPVKRMLERYGAAKVFIEGDAIILAIYETEVHASHAARRGRAGVLAREILAVNRRTTQRAKTANLPAAGAGHRRGISGLGAVALDRRRFDAS